MSTTFLTEPRISRSNYMYIGTVTGEYMTPGIACLPLAMILSIWCGPIVDVRGSKYDANFMQ